MGRRWGLGIVVVVALLAGALLAGGGRDQPVADGGGPAGGPGERPRAAAAAAERPRAELPPPPLSPERDADRRLAAHLGLPLYECLLPGGDVMSDWDTILPSGQDLHVVWFSRPERSGVNALVASYHPFRVDSVLRWWTEPDGSTRCVEEPAVPLASSVTVLDEQGRPAPGVDVYVMSTMTGAVPTGPDGTRTFDLYNGQVVQVELIARGFELEPVSLRAGDAVTVRRPIPDRNATPIEVADPIQRRTAAQLVEVFEALDEVLADPDLPPPTRAALVEQRDTVEMLTERAKTWFNPDGSPAPIVVHQLPR